MCTSKATKHWLGADVKRANAALRSGKVSPTEFTTVMYDGQEYTNFRGLQLRGQFAKVNWLLLDLSMCNAEDATIRVAMRDCIFKNADVRCFVGNTCVQCDFSGATLGELVGTFTQCNFQSAIASRVNAHEEAVFVRCDFSCVKFVKCFFPGCIFDNCKWSDSAFRFTDLTDAVFRGTSPPRAALDDTNFLDGIRKE